MRLGAAGVATVLVTMVLSSSVAQAAPGDLDASFGAGGKQTVNFGGADRATHVAIAPDGRIVVVGSTDATGSGDFAVARLTSGGAPDSTFGSGGRTSLGTQAGVDDIGAGVVVLGDERIVVAGLGNATRDFVIKRLNANGSLDTTFAGAGAGTAVVDFGATETVNAMVAQPDGKLVVVGSTGGDFAIVRLNADGTPDTSFSGDGRQTVDFGGADEAIAVTIAADGKIVLAGRGGPGSDMVITRLNTNGTVDTSFAPATSGEAFVDFGGTDVGNGVALQADGKIVVIGTTSAVGSGDFAAARLTANGSLDSTFSGDGKVTAGYAAPNEQGLAVAIQQNGRILLSGTGDVNNDFVVTRLNPDGSGDTSFGTADTVGVDFGGFEFDGDIALEPDGKIVMVGSTNNSSDASDIAIARVQGDPVTSTPPPPPPPPHAVLTTQPSPDGNGVVVSAAGTTGATTLIWDLNGDGKPDSEGTPDSPFVKLTLPRGETRTVCVTAVSATGASDRTCVTVKVPGTGLPANGVPQVAVLAESPSLFTPKPAPACIQGRVLQGLVDAQGCFVHVTKLADVPSRERHAASLYFGAEGLPSWFVKLCEDPTKAASCKAYEKTFARVYSGYLSTKAVKLNGMTLTPAAGATVVVDPQSARIYTSKGTLKLSPFVLKKSTVVNLDFSDLFRHSGKVRAGDLSYSGVTKALFSFDARKDVPIIGGFPLAAGAEIQFASDQGVRKSKVTLHVQLPKVFDAFGSGEQPSAEAAVSATNSRSFFLDNLNLQVPHASIGGIGLNNLTFSYKDGGDRAANCPRKYWHATADIQLGNGPDGKPGAGFKLSPPPTQNGVAFCAGGFDSAGGQITFGYPIPPPQLFPAVFLDNINFAIKLHPTLIRGGAQISAAKLTRVNGTLLAVFAKPWEPYTLTRSDAGSELQDIAPRTFTSTTFAVGGSLAIQVPSIGELNIAHGALMYSYPDYMQAGARVDVQLGIFVFRGSLAAQFNARTKAFEADLQADICVRGVSIACAGGLGIVSSKGVVACLHIGPFHPGVGLKTNLKYEVWLIDGCKPSHYWVRNISARRAAAAQATGTGAGLSFTVAKGETAKNLRLDGVGGAPKVLVRGPGGQSLSVDGDGLLHAGSLVALRADTFNATFLGVTAGKPGRYTITPLPGSVPLGTLSGTRAGYDTHFTGRVTGHGDRRTLHYDARKRGGGQAVTFYEDGTNVMHQIGTSTGGLGTLRFTPAAGRRGLRKIVARATVDGVPIADQVIARYQYAGTVRTGRPSRVDVRRSGSSLVVRWSGAPGAVRYGVLVNRSGGSQQRVELSARHHTLRIRQYPLTEGGRVSVSARGILGDWGGSRQSRPFKATKVAATVLVTHPFKHQRHKHR